MTLPPCLLAVSLESRKSVFGISDLVRHKPGCTAPEDGKRLEFLDREFRRK